MRVLAHEQRPADSSVATVLANRLRDRKDMRLREGPVERRSAVSARAKAHEIVRICRIGRALVVLAFELAEVDQQFGRHRFSS